LGWAATCSVGLLGYHCDAQLGSVTASNARQTSSHAATAQWRTEMVDRFAVWRDVTALDTAA
jgi:hypothetical protein